MAHVVVVGAGIIGASISKHLAERGAKVSCSVAVVELMVIMSKLALTGHDS